MAFLTFFKISMVYKVTKEVVPRLLLSHIFSSFIVFCRIIISCFVKLDVVEWQNHVLFPWNFCCPNRILAPITKILSREHQFQSPEKEIGQGKYQQVIPKAMFWESSLCSNLFFWSKEKVSNRNLKIQFFFQSLKWFKPLGKYYLGHDWDFSVEISIRYFVSWDNSSKVAVTKIRYPWTKPSFPIDGHRYFYNPISVQLSIWHIFVQWGKKQCEHPKQTKVSPVKYAYLRKVTYIFSGRIQIF